MRLLRTISRALDSISLIPVVAIMLSACTTARLEEGIADAFAPPGGIPFEGHDREFFYDSGSRRVTMYYRQGIPHGVWTICDGDARPIVELSFENGVCRGIWTAMDDPFLKRLGLTRAQANADPTLVSTRMFEASKP